MTNPFRERAEEIEQKAIEAEGSTIQPLSSCFTIGSNKAAVSECKG